MLDGGIRSHHGSRRATKGRIASELLDPRSIRNADGNTIVRADASCPFEVFRSHAKGFHVGALGSTKATVE